MRVGVCAVAVLFGVTYGCQSAHAQAASASERVELRSADDLAALLSEEAADARTWRVTWTLVNSGLTLLTFGGLVILPRSQRSEVILGGAVSALSTGVTWWWPLDVEADAASAAKLSGLPARERATRLQALFENSARDEAARLSWPWHIGNFLSALVPAAVSWFCFHHRQAALFSLFSGFAAGEVEMLTQPTGLVGWRKSHGVTLGVAVGERRAMVTWGVAW